MDPQKIDQQRAEAFAGRMIGALNEGAIAIMTSIGHRTGLFDAMSGLPYSTSEEIASAANLDERYVREWLGAMVVGGIVEYDPEHGTYHLPPEHAAFLTRAASPENIAVTAQFIPVDGSGGGQRSSRSSAAAGACPTLPTRVSTRLWPKTAGSPWLRRCSTTSYRSCRG